MTTPNYYNWDDMSQTTMTACISRRMVSGEKMTVVLYDLARGATVAQHQHPHEQMIYVISGEIDFESDGERRVLKDGDVVHLPSNVSHGGVAVEDTVTLEIFSPRREDFLTNAPLDYMLK
jgi:quercetin dioxygenase-like cupin family protein